MKRVLPLLVAAAILLPACNGAEDVGGSPSDAMAIADGFLDALETHDADAAWSLLYPPNRTARFDDDRAAFDGLVNDIDLSDVDWTIVSAAPDGDGRYRVDVDIDSKAIDDSLGVFVQVARTDGIETGGVMSIDIEPLLGSSGVLGG